MLLMVAFQTIILVGLLYFKGFGIDHLFFPAILGIVLTLLSLLVLILFFSSFTSPMIAMFLTIASYIIGHSGYAMLDAAHTSPALGYVGKAVLTFFPNLEAMNLKSYVATDAPIEISKWFLGYGMGALYIVVVLFL